LTATAARPATLLPALALFGSMVSVNTGAAIAKSLFPLIGSTGVTALRVGIATILLLAAFRPWRRPIARADIGNLLVYGLMLGCMNLLIYGAFQTIPIGVAVAIEVTGPLAVVVLHSRRARDFAWVACAVLGLYLLLPLSDVFSHQSAPLAPAGVAYASGAALCWALYIVFGKRVAHMDGTQAVSWGMLAACFLALPLGVAHAGAKLFAPHVLAVGVAIAVLSSGVPYLLEMTALRRLPHRVFGILVSSSPAIAALAGFVLLGERLTSVQWLAMALIIGASAGSAAIS
jgi:inner membrane transporter RhtA